MGGNDAQVPAHDLQTVHGTDQRTIGVQDQALRTDGGEDLLAGSAGGREDGSPVNPERLFLDHSLKDINRGSA